MRAKFGCCQTVVSKKGEGRGGGGGGGGGGEGGRGEGGIEVREGERKWEPERSIWNCWPSPWRDVIERRVT